MKKLYKIAIALFLFIPYTSFAAIAFDTEANYTACVTGTSCTYSFTVTGSNTFLFCNSTSYATNPGAVTMTYGGVSMTQIGSTQNVVSDYSYAFYLVNPATGANNLVNTTGTSLTNGFYTHCESYTGVGGTDGTNQSTGTSVTTKACTVTTTFDNNEWLIGGVSSYFGRGYTAGASTIVRGGDSQGWVGDSNGTVAVGSNTLTFNTASADNDGIDCIAIKQSVDPAIISPMILIKQTTLKGSVILR